MQPVALSAGEISDLLLLIRAAKVELRQIRSRVDLTVAHLDLIAPFGDFLIRRLRTVENAPLIHVRQRHRLADLQLTTIRLLLPEDQSERRRLPRPVRPDHAADATTRQ